MTTATTALPSISHPSDRPNFTVVRTARGAIAYSYATPVAYCTDDTDGWIVRKNAWGPTTGKHLNWCDGGSKQAKALRLDSATFEARIGEAFA